MPIASRAPASLTLLALLFGGKLAAADLFNDPSGVPEVLTATRLKQSPAEVPGSISVLDRELIVASGARDIPELMRLVPGMMVGYLSGNQPTVNYHGTSMSGARRLQVLIDGRSVYRPGLASVDWSDLPLAEPPVLQQPDASSGADGFGNLNLDLDLDWGALENPLDNPDLPRRAAAGKAEPAEEPLAFESNLHELPDVAEYEHLELDQPEPATVPPEEASASLDRARACIDSGDLDQASRILRLVVAHGDPWQKAEARELLALIA